MRYERRSALTCWLAIVMLPATFNHHALAGEAHIAGHHYQHVTKFEGAEVDSDHFLGAFQGLGITVYDDGTVSNGVIWGQMERIKGAGHDRGYLTQTWPDGASLTERFESEAVSNPDGTTSFSVNFEYVSGSGRFENVSGEGTAQGTGFSNGMLSVAWEATRILPD